MRYCTYYSTQLASSFRTGRNLPVGNDLYHSCTSFEGTSWKGQPLNIFTWFIGSGGLSIGNVKLHAPTNPSYPAHIVCKLLLHKFRQVCKFLQLVCELLQFLCECLQRLRKFLHLSYISCNLLQLVHISCNLLQLVNIPCNLLQLAQIPCNLQSRLK